MVFLFVMMLATVASILLNHRAKNSGAARQFCSLCALYTHLQMNKPLNCRISFNPAFRHSAQRVLGHRRGQFSQRTGTDQGISVFTFRESPLLRSLNPFSPKPTQTCSFLPFASPLHPSPLCSLLPRPAGRAGGRGGRQPEDRPAESQGGGWSQPAVCCQPLHCSVSLAAAAVSTSP